MTSAIQIKLLAAILAVLVVIAAILARQERRETRPAIPLTQTDRATQDKMLRKMQPETEHKYLVP